MDGADVVRVGCGRAFADRPHRLVGDDDSVSIVIGQEAHSCPRLPKHVVERRTRVAWCRLSDAHDRGHLVTQHLAHLERHCLVCLTVIPPALGVPDLDE